MKKIIITISLFFALLAFSDDAYFEDTLYFSGIWSTYKVGDAKYTVENLSLSTQLEHMNRVHTNGSPKILIGHSAGALKAMAYATDLSENGKSNEVKGVVSIMGPLKGFPGMSNGKGYLNYRISNKISILEGGTEALVDLADTVIATATAIIPIVPIPPEFINSIFLGTKTTVKDLMNSVSLNIFKEPLLLTGISDNFLNDIKPNSDFMKNRVYAKQTIRTSGYYQTRKVATGWGYFSPNYSSKTTWWGWTYNYISSWTWAPEYRTYQVYINPTYNSIPRLNKDIPVGIIVGTDNDPLNLLKSSDRKNLNEAFDALKNLLIAGEALQYTKAAFFYSTVILIPLGVQSTNRGISAAKSRDILTNYKKHYGDIIGGYSSDSFITEDAQVYPIEQLGGKKADIKLNQYIWRTSALHFNGPTDDEIWGPGGGAVYDDERELQKDCIKIGGAMHKIFQAQGWPIQ